MSGRQLVLDALEEHRRAGLNGARQLMLENLDPKGPHYRAMKAYFETRLDEGFTRYEFTVRDVRMSDDDRVGHVELDAVIALGGFEPEHMQYSFTFRRNDDDRYLLFNLKEYRLHLLPGYDPSSFDQQPIVVTGSSAESREIGKTIADRLGTEVVCCDQFSSSWNDLILIDFNGDNAVCESYADGVTTVYGKAPGYRFTTVVKASTKKELKDCADRAIAMIENQQVPSVDAEPEHDGVYLKTIPECQMLSFDDRHVALARKVDEQAAPDDYMRAVLKWYRYLLQDPMLDAAIIVANMMSKRQSDIASKIAGPTQLLTMRNLARYVHTHLEHQERVYHDLGKLWGNVRLFPTNPSLSCDEMIAFFPDHDLALGMCGPLQYFNLATLRLSGMFSESDLIQIRILSGEIKHEVLCVLLDGEHYLCTGIECVKMDNNFYRFAHITHLFNERYYRGGNGSFSMTDEQLRHRFDHLVKPLSHNFHIADDVLTRTNPRTDLLPQVITEHVKQMAPDDVSKAIQSQVLRFCVDKPHSHYGYARYAYQSLLVKKPQAYALASIVCPLAKKQAKQFSGVDDALLWIERNIDAKQVFTEPDRIQHADQVMVYRRGNARDRAMLLFAFVKGLGLDGAVIVSQDTGYVLYWQGDTPVIIDMQDYKRVDKTKRAEIVFDENTCYHRALGVNDLDDKLCQLLELK